MKTNKVPMFFGLHANPGPYWGKVLGMIPLLLLVLGYMKISHDRREVNPEDKLAPSIGKMYEDVKTYVSVPDKRSGEILFFLDAKSSLKRLGYGITISAVMGYVFGILLGLYPGARALFNPLVTNLSNINPLAILVVVLITLGTGEVSKVFLVVFGVGIPMIRNIQQAVQGIKGEVIIKQETLGASQFGIICRIVAPQMLPCLINLVRVSLGAAWIFVIAAEAISATSGLGYRIYLQTRYMNMSLIFSVIAFTATIAFISDQLLQLLLKHPRFAWYSVEKK